MHWTLIPQEFWVMPFFSNAPLAAAEGRRVGY